MVKALSKKWLSSKYDVIIKAKATTTRIVDINNEIVRFESNDKGESITVVGTGTQMAPNQRGIAKVTGEGTMWTSAHRLSHLNGGRWKVEGEVNTTKETVEVRSNFIISNI